MKKFTFWLGVAIVPIVSAFIFFGCAAGSECNKHRYIMSDIVYKEAGQFEGYSMCGLNNIAKEDIYNVPEVYLPNLFQAIAKGYNATNENFEIKIYTKKSPNGIGIFEKPYATIILHKRDDR